MHGKSLQCTEFRGASRKGQSNSLCLTYLLQYQRLCCLQTGMSNSESSNEKDSPPSGSSNDSASHGSQEPQNHRMPVKRVTAPRIRPVNIRPSVTVKVSLLLNPRPGDVKLLRKHRLCISTTLSFRDMEELLIKIGNFNDISLTYEDDDSDCISVCSDEDMPEMFNLANRIHPRALRMKCTQRLY